MLHRMMRRMAAAGLCLALAAAAVLPAVCEDAPFARRLISWKGAQLAEEAAKTGLLNRQGQPVFTTYQDQIGLQAPKGTNDYLLHSWQIPHQLQDQLLYKQGDTLALIVKVWNPDDNLEEGEFVTPELCYDWSGANLVFGETMTAADYAAQPVQIDPTYGFSFKEWVVSASLEDASFDQADLLLQIRVRSHGTGTLNLYGLEVYNETTDTSLVDANGMQLNGQSNVAPLSLRMGQEATGIVSYGGDPSGRGEPYSRYNTNGIVECEGHDQTIVSDPEGALLLDGLPVTLSAGDYRFQFNFFTQFSWGVRKAVFRVQCGGDTLAAIPYTLFTLNDRLGIGRADLYGQYDTFPLDFSVDEAHAGQPITVQIVLHNCTDFYLREIALEKWFAADAQPDEQTREALDILQGLGWNATANELDRAEQAVASLTLEQACWLAEEDRARVALLRQYQTDREQVARAVEAIGAITDETVDGCLEQIDMAERLLQQLADDYGEEASATLPQADALRTIRAQADQLLADRRQRAIDRVAALIAAVGPITPDDYAEKKDPLETAEQALAELVDAYGEEAADGLDTAGLREARAAYDALVSAAAVTPGDINADTAVNAADALLALQHSVKLIVLENDRFTSADVDGSGAVNAADALLILQYSVKLITGFPVEAA